MFEQEIRTLKVLLGYEICPTCGSSNIIRRGFDGVNLRYDCKDCGQLTYIEEFLMV